MLFRLIEHPTAVALDNKVRALVLEYDSTDDQGRDLQKILDHSLDPSFQIDRNPVSAFQQGGLPNAPSFSRGPQIIILILSGDSFPQLGALFPALKQKFPDIPTL